MRDIEGPIHEHLLDFDVQTHDLARRHLPLFWAVEDFIRENDRLLDEAILLATPNWISS